MASEENWDQYIICVNLSPDLIWKLVWAANSSKTLVVSSHFVPGKTRKLRHFSQMRHLTKMWKTRELHHFIDTTTGVIFVISPRCDTSMLIWSFQCNVTRSLQENQFFAKLTRHFLLFIRFMNCPNSVLVLCQVPALRHFIFSSCRTAPAYYAPLGKESKKSKQAKWLLTFCLFHCLSKFDWAACVLHFLHQLPWHARTWQGPIYASGLLRNQYDVDHRDYRLD